MGVQVLAGWPWRPSSKAGLLLSRATAYRLWLRACCEGPEAIGGGTAEKQAGLGRRILPSDPTIHGIDQARFGGTEISAIIHRHAPQKQNTIRAVHATHHQRKCSIEARLSLHGYTAYWRETLMGSPAVWGATTARIRASSAGSFFRRSAVPHLPAVGDHGGDRQDRSRFPGIPAGWFWRLGR